MSIPKNIIASEKAIGEWAILVGYRGSIAHGMYVPQENKDSIDDKDIMGVFIPPLDYYFALETYSPPLSRGTQEIKFQEWDIVTYEVKKFVSLLANANPNVLSLLWVEPNLYTHTTPEGLEIREHRELFATKKAFHSFSGYAKDQLYKMEHLAFEGYMGQKRKMLVERHGYDTKNAAHLIRLLRMGIEFLNDGELQVMRPDNQELLAIKRGEWTIERVKAEAEHLFKRAEEAYDRSKLPVEPDYGKINNLCLEVVSEWFKRHGVI